MRGLLEAVTLVLITVACGAAVAAWVGAFAGIAINVARWFL